jgi:hypothetical protein
VQRRQTHFVAPRERHARARLGRGGESGTLGATCGVAIRNGWYSFSYVLLHARHRRAEETNSSRR